MLFPFACACAEVSWQTPSGMAHKVWLNVAHWQSSSDMSDFLGSSSSNVEHSEQEERMAQAAAIGRIALEPSAGLLAGLVQERLEALPRRAQAGQVPHVILALCLLSISFPLQ